MDERDYTEYLDPREAVRQARRDREHPADPRAKDRLGAGRAGRGDEERGRRRRDQVRWAGSRKVDRLPEGVAKHY